MDNCMYKFGAFVVVLAKFIPNNSNTVLFRLGHIEVPLHCLNTSNNVTTECNGQIEFNTLQLII